MAGAAATEFIFGGQQVHVAVPVNIGPKKFCIFINGNAPSAGKTALAVVMPENVGRGVPHREVDETVRIVVRPTSTESSDRSQRDLRKGAIRLLSEEEALVGTTAKVDVGMPVIIKVCPRDTEGTYTDDRQSRIGDAGES